MTEPTRTPNTATSTRPERSSKKVARKKPLGFLPWLLLGLLALLLAAIFLAINAIDDDGPSGPEGDSLGQSSSGGSGLDGQDGDGQLAGTEEDSSVGSSTGPAAAPTAVPGAGPSAAAQPGGGAPAAGGSAALAAGALVGGGGIPAATDSDAGTTLTAERQEGTAGTVLFPEGSAALDGEATAVITQAARGLQEAGVTSVEVIGYTDKIAGEAVNDPLSQQRADAVAKELRKLLPGANVTTSALGAEQPVASNDDEKGRQQNRRAAIIARD